MSNSGPTASKATLPFWPASSGSATFNANVIKLEKTNNRRAGRSCSRLAPCNARYRVPSSNPSTERSTAGATRGATHGGTPNRSAKDHTLPKPNKNVSPTTAAMIPVTARSVTARSKAALPRLLAYVAPSPVIGLLRPR